MNDGDAQTEVGRRYYYGIGVRKNFLSAVEYYKNALDSDNITEYGRQEAMYYLGIAYYEGKGVKKSAANAKTWFEKANADDDHDKAREKLNSLSLAEKNRT